MVKIGDFVYVDSDDDIDGGLAEVVEVEKSRSAGKDCIFIKIKGFPATSINWGQYLEPMQNELRQEYGNKNACLQPEE